MVWNQDDFQRDKFFLPHDKGYLSAKQNKWYMGVSPQNIPILDLLDATALKCPQTLDVKHLYLAEDKYIYFITFRLEQVNLVENLTVVKMSNS